jgi:uncharacterized repeat protein (TIGR01451 family)
MMPAKRVLTALLCVLLSYSAFSQRTVQQITERIQRSDYGADFRPQDLASVELQRTITNRKTGHFYHYLQQKVNGIPVHNALMTVVETPEGEVIHVADRFLKGIERMGAASSASLTPEQALTAAAAHLKVQPSSPERIQQPIGTLQKGVFNTAGISLEDIPFQLVYQEAEGGQLRLAWELVIRMTDHANWWQIRVDAANGAILGKNNWITTCNFGDSHSHEAGCLKEVTGRNPMLRSSVAASAASTPEAAVAAPAPVLANSYNVFAAPLESPYDGPRTIETLPWSLNPIASPFGWHDTNGASGAEFTITRGNNVWAQEDRNGDNGTGFSPDGGAALDFDFPLDLNLPPVDYQEAAITNLFFWNNLSHDIFYNYGFDEQSGNFQVNNYGNGGLGNDEVLADAQDGSGVNNANFGTPPDGQQPRMQMFEWNVPPVGSVTANGTGYGYVVATFGPNSGNYTGELVLADDGSVDPTLACNPLVTPPDYTGKIVLIDRGSCTFVSKVLNAQNAGAIAVIVAQNTGDAPFAMGGTEPAITIPSVMVSLADGDALKAQLAGGTVTAELNLPSAVNRDSDLDNGVIVHEYGHGVSIRLTAGADNVGCLFNNEQMGEGWSDYLALILTMKPGDAANDARAIGNYSLGDGPNGPGIRPFPYSYDMSVNPMTYNSIGGVSIPHGVGSVWCTMLWDMTWLLIDEYGWDPDVYNGTGGNNIALQLVIEGMKLQPCNPGFVDGRDAILLADQILYGGANQCIIWQAFSRRGLGVNADQGSTANTTDGTESYQTAGPCAIDITKTSSDELQAGNSMTVTLTISNNTGAPATNVQVTDVIPSEVNYVAGSASCSASFNAGTLTLDLGTMNDGESIVCTYQVQAPASPFSQFQLLDDIESGTGDFVVTTASGPFQWEQVTSRANSPVTSWFAPDPNEISDQYLDLPNVSGITGSTFLSFWHFYNTEANWDGCVLELSTDGGVNWIDAQPYFTLNGYNGTLNTNPESPISGRPAWTGGSGGFIQTTVDLSSFAGQTLNIRWRMGADQIIAGEGWYIDDIFIGESLIDFTNTACVVSDQTQPLCSSQYTLITEQTCTPTDWYEDADGDGFGNAAIALSDCFQPAGYVADNTDCDDARNDVYPGAPGTAEGVDNNCDGNIDSFECAPQIWYEDADGDGFGNNAVTASDCIQPTGFVVDNTDCDDTRNDIYPGAPGTAEGIDNNCDGNIDSFECAPQTWYEDADGDGFGNSAVTASDCIQPVGYVSNNADCDDTRNDVYPDAPGTAEGVDNNCDGNIDSFECAPQTWYEDADGDGFGNNAVTASDCIQPVGYVSNNADCDDTRNDVYPDAPGTAEGVDNNCNGLIDATEEVPGCYGDLNLDGLINIADLLVLLSDFGCAGSCVGDLNADGVVSSGDMLEFLSVFDTTCP